MTWNRVNALSLLMALILTAVALLHVYWALGGKTARTAAVPESAGRPAFSPTPGTTLAVAAGLLGDRKSVV